MPLKMSSNYFSKNMIKLQYHTCPKPFLLFIFSVFFYYKFQVLIKEVTTFFLSLGESYGMKLVTTEFNGQTITSINFTNGVMPLEVSPNYFSQNIIKLQYHVPMI